MNPIIDELKNTLKDKSVLVACSSGVDSTVLLDLVLKANTYNKVVIAHVNHKRRQKSDLEEAYLQAYATSKDIKIYIKQLNQANQMDNFQAWARNERYQFFQEIAKLEAIDYVLTAHHANDQAETILMRMMKQASIRAYAGMKKWGYYQNLTLYRPLLEVPKAEIIKYANKQNLKYFEDESNHEDDYLRNRIRKYIMPFFLEENPAYLQAISQYGKDLHELADLLEEITSSFIKQEVVVNNNDIMIDISAFQAQKPLLQVEVLFTLLKSYQLSRDQIDEIIKQINANKQPIIYPITTKLYMIKEYGKVIFTTNFQTGSFYLEISKEGKYLLPNNEEILITKNISNYKATYKKLWYNIKELPIVIRTRQDGDRIKLKQGTKTVSDYLTDKKVSHLIRNQLLLLCDKDNSVIAMLGLESQIKILEDVENLKGGNNGTN